MKFLLLLLFTSLSIAATPREEAAELLSSQKDETRIIQRLDLFSQSFLGLPYGEGGPLGEGPRGRYDQDPLYRFDTFDCTTFLETVLSLALSSEVDAFERRMDEIRYEHGQVDYLTRNHFPSLQWIPFNVASGVLEEINHLLLPVSKQGLAEATIDLPGWLRAIKLAEIRVPMASPEERQALLQELHDEAANFSPVKARLTYLPISSLLAKPKLLKKIPHGAIVNFVRPNWDLRELIGTHMNVSHQGFVFQVKGVPTLRHASSAGEKRVVNVPLLEYLQRFKDHPTLKGIHLMRVTPHEE